MWGDYLTKCIDFESVNVRLDEFQTSVKLYNYENTDSSDCGFMRLFKVEIVTLLPGLAYPVGGVDIGVSWTAWLYTAFLSSLDL